MSARNKLTHFLICKCEPACAFYKRTSCPAWQQHKKDRAEEAKKNRLAAAKRRVKLVRAKKNAHKNTAVDIQTDYLGWQHTAQKHMKATARLREHLAGLSELDIPVERCDGRLTRILCWKIVQLGYDLDKGPNDDDVPCPTFKEAYTMCLGFGYPTTRPSGQPLFPEWKRFCSPPKSRSCLKKGKKKSNAFVQWEESLQPRVFQMTFPSLPPPEPVVITGIKLDMFPAETPLLPWAWTGEPTGPEIKRRNVLGWNTQKSVGPGKRTSILCGLAPPMSMFDRPQPVMSTGRTVSDVLRENRGDLYLTLLPGETRAVLENEGVPGLQAYDEAIDQAVATAKYQYEGARNLSDETLTGIIKAQAERARNSSLLSQAQQKHLDRCRMDSLWWTYCAFFTSNYGPPKDPLAWWRAQSSMNIRRVQQQTFLGCVTFLAKNMPDVIKTVPVAGQPTRYKARARITEADFKERLTLIDLTSAPIDFEQIAQ